MCSIVNTSIFYKIHFRQYNGIIFTHTPLNLKKKSETKIEVHILRKQHIAQSARI